MSATLSVSIPDVLQHRLLSARQPIHVDHLQTKQASCRCPVLESLGLQAFCNHTSHEQEAASIAAIRFDDAQQCSRRCSSGSNVSAMLLPGQDCTSLSKFQLPRSCLNLVTLPHHIKPGNSFCQFLPGSCSICASVPQPDAVLLAPCGSQCSLRKHLPLRLERLYESCVYTYQ